MNRWHPLPAEVYGLVERTPGAVLLDCGKPKLASNEAWTQLFLAPLHICEAHTAAELADLFTQIENAIRSGWTAAGYFTYECGACFEPKAGMHPLPADQPLAWFGIYERSYCFDHAIGDFVDGIPSELSNLPSIRESTSGQAGSISACFTLTEADYAQSIATIHEWIRAGDVYQLNFTGPLRVEATVNAAEIYAQLRLRQPVEYGAFLHWRPGRHVLSFSPELFFRIEEEGGRRCITTRPMKGTASRGRTTAEDRERTEWLRSDAKNRAENLMIVDLLRNDLGRLATFGSVHVEDLFAVERYPTLWQMTSTIKAELRREANFQDIFRALFPCGSITGAPKVRAMQLLAELEGQPRGVYTGAIGYFASQRTVFNVAIRTLDLEGHHGTMGVGSGVVIDSDAAQEYRECLLKAEFVTETSPASAEAIPTCDEFSLIETMLWQAGYPLLELHLDRLCDSADYFDIACARAEIKAALQEYAMQFNDRIPRRVRLLIDQQGEIRISDEVLPLSLEKDRVARVCISQHRTDPAFRFLFHKSTRRSLYAQSHQQAAQAGYDDVLFFNHRGELTEGAISNVYVEKDGGLFTPPVKCGLLPGVYRRHLLETRADLEERILSKEDLRSADAVYISNAVRGLRPAQVSWDTGSGCRRESEWSLSLPDP